MDSIQKQREAVENIRKKYRSLPWTPLAALQKATSRDGPARGNVWIGRMHFRAPQDTNLRDVLYKVIDCLKADYHQITPAEDTELNDVGVKFIGPRSGVGHDAPEPHISEEAKLQALEKECRADMTILYVHGGAL